MSTKSTATAATASASPKPAASPKSAKRDDAPKISLFQITSSYNHRNPLSAAFREAGYGVFAADVPPDSDKKPLWELATSKDAAERNQFVELMEKYETAETAGKESITRLAFNILSVGQINNINIRSNGGNKKPEEQTYQLVAGHRRSLAILYNWCKGLAKSSEPRAKYSLASGNHQALQAMSISENIHRKSLNLIEQATAYKQAINSGETIDEVAQREGISVATLKGHLSLLELSPENQRRIADGKIRYTKALEMAKNAKAGRGEVTNSGSDGESESSHKRTRTRHATSGKMMKRFDIEAWYADSKDAAERRILAKVLGLDETKSGKGGKGKGKSGKGDDEAEEAEEVELDAKGNIVPAKAKK